MTIQPSILDSINPAGQPIQRTFKAMTRKQIAAHYRVDTKTLRKWCERANIKLPNGMLPPNQVRRIFDTLGEWEE